MHSPLRSVWRFGKRVMCRNMVKPETTDLREYLISETVVDWVTPSVSSKARELTLGLGSEIDRAQRLFEWVRDEIPHSKDIDSDIVTCSASEVLHVGTGICFAKSHLLAALLRAVGTPAGFCYQVLTQDSATGGLALHGLNGLYLPSLGRWIRVDARGSAGRVNARFGIEQEQLEFRTDSSSGEFTYDTVFSKPAPQIVSLLRRFSSRRALWPHLPERLGDEREKEVPPAEW